ncbi:MAG: hypothetical protein F6J86_20695 [Symploca sp. SIO1B1]|nr:hypothetical protein [Symploca sp. SIO1B1]
MEIFLEPEFTDLSLEDLERSEQMLKDSLFKVGRMAGLSDVQLEADWQQINQQASESDIHIDSLQDIPGMRETKQTAT